LGNQQSAPAPVALPLGANRGTPTRIHQTGASGYLRQSRSNRSGYPTLLLWNATSHASRGGATVAPPRRCDTLDPHDPAVYFVSQLRAELQAA